MMNNVNKHAVLMVEAPNLITIFWVLFCVRTTFFMDEETGNYLYYIIIGLAFTNTLLSFIRGKRVSPTEKSMLFWFTTLVLLQIFGLLQILSAFSIRNILASVCVFCFIDSIAFNKNTIQIGYFRIVFYPSLLIILMKSISGVQFGNLIPGCIVFLTAAYIAAEYSVVTVEESQIYKSDINYSAAFILSIIAIGTSVVICFISRARTALFTIAIIFLFFLYIHLRKKISANKIKVLFWILAFLMIIVCVAYANIHLFAWYNNLNTYSVLYFNKNIDSSRPYLWKFSFEGLSWWQKIIGAGTGKLPDISKYMISSFHNTYLQLIMQNGIIGLLTLVFVLWDIWKNIAEYYIDNQQKVILAIFVGVLIYNCFEVTLLQNKAFLGMIQWMILSIGLLRNESLKRYSWCVE